MHPKYPIMASVGNDETLKLWDIRKKVNMVNKSLGMKSSCLGFSPDGAYLAVGMNSGFVLILDSHIKKLNYGTFAEEFLDPSLDVICSPKESKSAAINLKFSTSGEFLVVAYNNLSEDSPLYE